MVLARQKVAKGVVVHEKSRKTEMLLRRNHEVELDPEEDVLRHLPGAARLKGRKARKHRGAKERKLKPPINKLCHNLNHRHVLF